MKTTSNRLHQRVAMCDSLRQHANACASRPWVSCGAFLWNKLLPLYIKQLIVCMRYIALPRFIRITCTCIKGVYVYTSIEPPGNHGHVSTDLPPGPDRGPRLGAGPGYRRLAAASYFAYVVYAHLHANILILGCSQPLNRMLHPSLQLHA